MLKKIGICINFGGCDKAKAKEKQEVEATNFVCEKCGKPLRETNPDSKGPNKALIGGIAAAVIVLGGGGAYFALSGGNVGLLSLKLNKTSSECTVGVVDTLEIANEPADAVATYIWSSDNDAVATVNGGVVTMVSEGAATITVKAQENDSIFATCTYSVKRNSGNGNGNGNGGGNGGVVAPPINPNDLGWASYDGPMSGGKPHGAGGELTVKSNHSIDLKNGSALDVNPGDKIKNTKFTNGVLRQGELQRKNGERKYFNIG